MLHHFPLASGLVSLSRGNGEIRDIASAPLQPPFLPPKAAEKRIIFTQMGQRRGAWLGERGTKQNTRMGGLDTCISLATMKSFAIDLLGVFISFYSFFFLFNFASSSSLMKLGRT